MESMPMSGVIEYTSAGAIARLYDTVRQKLTEAEKLLNEASSVMKEADFEHLSDNRGFAIVVQYSPNKYESRSTPGSRSSRRQASRSS
jgi:hypothetical protein